MFALGKITPPWVKESGWKLVWQYRQVTSAIRSYPDFVVIGAQKSGSSSLYSYLGQHPEILPSFSKEVHFFDGGLDAEVDTYEKGHSWYRARFPIKWTLHGRFKTFEASPLYIFNPLVAKRMFDHIPSTKIIVVLRNPTERAISHYFHEKRWGFEQLPIQQALQQEEERLKAAFKDQDYKSNNFIHHSYKARGLYKVQLERFFRHFPRRQVLILSSEELFEEPANTLRKIFEFVSIDAEFQIQDLQPRNVASNKGAVDAKIYAYLDEFFSPHNQDLYDLVGRNFAWGDRNI